MKTHNPAIWQAQTLRLTVFCVEAVHAMAQNWWEQGTGELPENQSSQPKGAVRQDDGSWRHGTLTLKVEKSRIDWIYAARVDIENAEEADVMPNLGSFLSAAEVFQSLCEKWIFSCPPCLRIAFGAILIQPASSHAAGYKVIDDYLPFEVDPESRDFMYRVNRPRQSTVLKEFTINRLSTWSVMAIHRIRAQITGAGLSVDDNQSGESEYAARLELDVNTDQNRQDELPPDARGPLFGELLTLAKEIATKGDSK